MRATRTICELTLASLLVGLLAISIAQAAPAPVPEYARYVVQAATLAEARQDVQQVGGTIERNLDVVHAVAAYLSTAQVASLRARADVRVFEDRAMRTEGLLSVLGSVTAPAQNLTNSVNATVATNPLVTAATRVTTPVTAAVTQVGHPLVAPLTAPLVTALSSNTALKDGTGVAASTLLYQTNYPQLVGADTLQTFRYITFPVIRTALIAGGLLAFALSFDEVIVTTFTAGTEKTVPLWIFGEILRAHQLPVVNVVAVFLILLSTIPVYLAQRLSSDTTGVAGR